MIDFEAWEEHLKVLRDVDDGELKLRTLVAVEVSICTDEFCESCDTVYADFGRPDARETSVSEDERATTPKLEDAE